MYCNAFHFQCNRTYHFKSWIFRNTKQVFHVIDKRKRMTNYGISGNRFRQDISLQKRFFSLKQMLYTTMLVSQLNFQMKYVFSITGKPEMTGLNYSGMNWANTHLMKIPSFY